MFEKLGGKDGISKLVDDFYLTMSSDSEAKEVFATHHGYDLKVSAQKLKAFLSGWTGGPQDYLNTYGHPRLRMRHSQFSISPVEAEQWLNCMRKALNKSEMSKEDQLELITALENVTQMLINQS